MMDYVFGFRICFDIKGYIVSLFNLNISLRYNIRVYLHIIYYIVPEYCLSFVIILFIYVSCIISYFCHSWPCLFFQGDMLMFTCLVIKCKTYYDIATNGINLENKINITIVSFMHAVLYSYKVIINIWNSNLIIVLHVILLICLHYLLCSAFIYSVCYLYNSIYNYRSTRQLAIDLIININTFLIHCLTCTLWTQYIMSLYSQYCYHILYDAFYYTCIIIELLYHLNLFIVFYIFLVSSSVKSEYHETTFILLQFPPHLHTFPVYICECICNSHDGTT